MKATDKAYEKLEAILNAHGFELTEGFAGKQIKVKAKTAYIGLQLWDKVDGYENTGDFEKFRANGHLEVTASISRMGGEMSAEDFAEAARQMTAAQELLKELENTDLSYKTKINGEAA